MPPTHYPLPPKKRKKKKKKKHHTVNKQTSQQANKPKISSCIMRNTEEPVNTAHVVLLSSITYIFNPKIATH